jgi:hypothetical protein
VCHTRRAAVAFWCAGKYCGRCLARSKVRECKAGGSTDNSLNWYTGKRASISFME